MMRTVVFSAFHSLWEARRTVELLGRNQAREDWEQYLRRGGTPAELLPLFKMVHSVA